MGRAFPALSLFSITGQHEKVLSAITRCRTATLGGHRGRCSQCGHTACLITRVATAMVPRCQGNARRRWLQARQSELLPTPYIHIVFTLPRELAPLALQNKQVIYNRLFEASAHTLLAIARYLAWSQSRRRRNHLHEKLGNPPTQSRRHDVGHKRG